MNDRQIIEYLRARGQVSPPVDFTRSVMAALDSAPARGSRFSAYLPAFVAVGAAAMIAVLALFVGPGRDIGPAPNSSATPSATAEATVVDLRIALMESVDVLRAAPGVEGRQQAEIDGIIGTATWFDWRPNGDQVVVTRWDLDVAETGWWMVPDGAPPATGQRIYTNIQANVGDEFFFVTEDGDWQVAARDDGILAMGTGILDRSVLPWYPLMGFAPSVPDAPESEARVERDDLSDGEAEWRLEFEWLGTPLTQRWTIGPGGELRSWTMEREEPPVDPDGRFNDHVTHVWMEFTIADGEPIEPPDVDAAPDAAFFGLPDDFPLAPPEPRNVVRLSECPPSSAPYRLSLPDGWWTNTAFEHPDLGAIPACRYFAPGPYGPFDVTSIGPDQVVPEGVALMVDYIDGGCVGSLLPLISTRETAVDGHPATVTEYSIGLNAGDPPGRYEYVVDLAPGTDCEAGGRFIVAATDVQMAGDYETNKAIVDDMMSTIQIEP